VFLFRGTYYKSLPGRIRELEESDVRKDAALKRQHEELQMWKGVATQTPEIQKLLEFYERHEKNANDRMDTVDAQHSEILSHILKIEARLNNGNIGR
jgi:hypothetical protein